jgi:two-component system sensor histidine kinase EvgS
MHGTLEIHSQVNVGTEIVVCIACERLVGVAGARVERPNGMQLPSVKKLANPPRILLVEDTPANQMAAQAQLEALGCNVTCAPSGALALKALLASSFDLVLMDCDLPDMTGYDVVKQWRRIEGQRATTPTPVLATSAVSSEDHATACFDAGMDGVLNKPLKLATLRDALLLWCQTSVQIDIEPTPPLDQGAIVQALCTDMQKLREGWAAGDMATCAHFAHRLRGAASVIDAPDLAELTQALELSFRTSLKTGTVTPLDVTAISRLTQWLDRWSFDMTEPG